MSKTWQEYYEEQKKFAQMQVEARSHKTPATRLAHYYSAYYRYWRLTPDTVRLLDEHFAAENFGELSDLMAHPNQLVAAIATAMRTELAQIIAVAEGIVKWEEYHKAWWTDDNKV